MISRLGFWLCVVGLVCGTFVASACGPDFPNTYFLGGHESDVLRMPEASFYVEVCRISGQQPEPLAGVDPDDHVHWSNTLAADFKDTEEVLSPEQMANYRAFREAMSQPHYDSQYQYEYQMLVAPWAMTSSKTSKPLGLAEIVTLFSQLPKEFALYTYGAWAYHFGDYDLARSYWTDVLALPKEERHHRSTWAAFMLGRVLIRTKPAIAAQYFQKTRELAEQGFADSLGLAEDSVRWEANAELYTGNKAKPLVTYFAAFKSAQGADRTKAFWSIRESCERVLRENGPKNEIVNDPIARQIATAWAISNPHEEIFNKVWCKTLSDAQFNSPLEDADRLAWAAYQNADFDDARKWVELARPNLPLSSWVKSKLLLRDGHVGDAISVLRSIVSNFPESELWYRADSMYSWPQTRARVGSDLGVLLLGHQNYVDALDILARFGYWEDAAYVGERVLSIQELKQYVDAHAKTDELQQIDNEYFNEGKNRYQRLRYMLGRRMARSGYWNDALAYFPEDVTEFAKGVKAEFDAAGINLPNLKQGAVALRTSGVPLVPLGHGINPTRADRLCALANSLSDAKGLLSTEMEPDYFFVRNLYFFGGKEVYPRIWPAEKKSPNPEFAMRASVAEALAASSDEKQRVTQGAAAPDKRWHYRYAGAEMIWQASLMLPDNNLDTMRVLYQGGGFVKARDPEAADRFYKALVNRNPKMPYAQEADKLHWFPKEAPTEHVETKD